MVAIMVFSIVAAAVLRTRIASFKNRWCFKRSSMSDWSKRKTLLGNKHIAVRLRWTSLVRQPIGLIKVLLALSLFSRESAGLLTGRPVQKVCQRLDCTDGSTKREDDR